MTKKNAGKDARGKEPLHDMMTAIELRMEVTQKLKVELP